MYMWYNAIGPIHWIDIDTVYKEVNNSNTLYIYLHHVTVVQLFNRLIL